METNIQNDILVEPERRQIPSTASASGSALAYTKRGSFSVAASHAATAESRGEALAALEDGFYANSSKRPRASYLRTWEKMHREWFGDSVPVLPLTADKLKAVGALFKAGKYRGIANPLCSIKSLHQEMGHAWTDEREDL